ncbi:MAG: 2-amino-4-hydroxy-6-hydroxymethyldihydropteridine diphosphokinase [Cellvibrionaceae bacterium]|nr:2-amino-4-hydroxy-6-hydroxymethyldihydropteridine diphosphokinase [Cellvibrionaceae bacterium]
MALVYLSLGSNEDREFHIASCLDALSAQFGQIQLSSVYESESVGFKGEPFYNLVVAIETELSVGELNTCLKQIEDKHGRRRDVPRFSGRTLDVDILTYDNRVGEVDGVVLPRDEITENAFVLLPLAELAPEARHPELGQSYRHLWQAYDRNQRLWPVDFYWRGRLVSRCDG